MEAKQLPPRSSIRQSVQRRLISYFGGKRSVISGSSRNVEWAHIDDDRSNSEFVNLIPLEREENGVYFVSANRSRFKGQLFSPPHYLTPTALLRSASTHFETWNPALAYGCARLAFYVEKRYLRATEELLCKSCVHVLRALRHRPEMELLQNSISRDLIPILRQRVHLDVGICSLILAEIGCLYAEFGHQEDAEEILGRVSLRAYKTASNGIEYANILRRKAQSLIRVGKSAEALPLLAEAAQEGRSSPNILVGIAFDRGWAKMNTQDFAEAIDFIEPGRVLLEPYRQLIERIPPPSFWPGGKEVSSTPPQGGPAISGANVAHLLVTDAILSGLAKPGQHKRRIEADISNALKVLAVAPPLTKEVPFDWRTQIAGLPIPEGVKESLTRFFRTDLSPKAEKATRTAAKLLLQRCGRTVRR